MANKIGEVNGPMRTDTNGDAALDIYRLASHFFLRGAHRAKNVCVTGAAAKVAGEIFANLIVGWVWILF